MAENEGSEDFGDVLMIWSKKCLVGPHMAHDVVNPRTLELELAKEILTEICDVQLSEVEGSYSTAYCGFSADGDRG